MIESGVRGHVPEPAVVAAAGRAGVAGAAVGAGAAARRDGGSVSADGAVPVRRWRRALRQGCPSGSLLQRPPPTAGAVARPAAGSAG